MTPERRARRLVRLYPPRWRERYGEEFVALLIADIEERPHSPSRTFDVARSGVCARCSEWGIVATGPTSLAAFGCAVAAFLTFGTGLWSQLTIGWQWAAPDAPVIAVALLLMSMALTALIATGVAALVPIVWSAIMDRRTELIFPAVRTIAAAAVLVVGAIHVSHHWPGTGGRPWPGKHLVPAGIASFGWAATLSVTSYWAHPHALGTFPATQVVWMATAPIAIVTLLAGTVKIVRRVEVSPATLRYETVLAKLAIVAMLAFLGGALAWLVAANPGPRGLFQSGLIDVLDVAVTAGAVGAARALARRLTPSGTSAAPRACG